MQQKAFVLMPFAPEFDDVYEYLIHGPLTEAGFDVSRADDIRNQRNILHDILQSVTDCDLLVADLSTSNPNVYYELGLAHAFGKNVILLAQDVSELPFDLRSYRVVTYSTHFSRMSESREEMVNLAKGAYSGSVQFGSPVSDFGRFAATPSGRPLNPVTGHGNRDERGLFDYQSELEEGLEAMSAILAEVGQRLNAMTTRVLAANSRITGPDAASSKKKRSTMRELSGVLDDYAMWLKGGNAQYRQSLIHIGESLDAILSGEFAIDESGKASLRTLLGSLQEGEENAQKSRQQFADLVKTMENLPRIERHFNRSKQQLADEMTALTENIDQTVATLVRARAAGSRLLGDDPES